MEVLVVIAIILVLAAIAFPVISAFRMRGYKAVALNNMKNLGAAAGRYAAENDSMLPEEDAKKADTWQAAAKPESKDAWYNALPRLLGQKGVADFAATPRQFYSKENILFLPGAQYPDSDKKLRDPLFAIAINTKLHRKDPSDPNAKKERVRLSSITHPSKTVLFLEQGLPGEPNTASVQSKKDYDGSPKGSPKSFVGRYSGQGVLVFVSGNAEAVNVEDVLTETGDIPYPQTQIVWTRTPEENPNKDGMAASGSTNTPSN